MVNRAVNLFPELQGQTDQSESTAPAQPRNRALNLFSEENPRSTVPGQEPIDFQYRQNIQQTPSEKNADFYKGRILDNLATGAGTGLRGVSGVINSLTSGLGINNQDRFGLRPADSLAISNPVSMSLGRYADAAKSKGAEIVERNQPDQTVESKAPSLGLGDEDFSLGNPLWYADQATQQVSNLGVMALAGIVGGPLAAGGVGGSIAGGQLYEDLLDSGMSPDQAATRAIGFTPFSAALNSIPFEGYLGKGAGTTGSMLRRIFDRSWRGGASEVWTESIESGTEEGLKGGSVPEIVNAGFQGGAAAGPIGIGMGGGSGAMNIGGQNKPNTDVPPAPFKAPTPNDGSVHPAPTAAADPRLARPKNGKADLAGMIENGKITAVPVSDKPVVNQTGAAQDLLAPTGAQLKAAMLEAGFNENVTTLIALENARKGPDAGDVMADAYLKMIAKGIPDDVAYEVIAEPNPDVRAAFLEDYAKQVVVAQPPVEDVVAPEVVAPVDPIAPVDLLAPEPVAEPIAPAVEPEPAPAAVDAPVEPVAPVESIAQADPAFQTKLAELKGKIEAKKAKNAEKGKGPIREAKGARDSNAFSNMRGQPSTRIIKAGGLDQEAFYELQAAGLEVTPWRMNRSGRKKGGGMHPRQHALMFPKEGGMNLDRIAEWLMDNQQALSFDRTDMDAYGRPTRNATIQWLRENMFSTINTGKYRDRQDFQTNEDYISEDMAKYELEEAKKSRKPMSMYEFRELMQTAKGKSTGPKQAVPVMDLPAGSQVVIEGDTFTVHDNDETGEINLMNDVVVSVNPEQTIEVDSIKKVADQPEGDPFAFGEDPTGIAENETTDAGPFFNDAETIQTRPVNQDDGIEAPSLFKPEAGQGIRTESAVSRVVERKIGDAKPDLPGQMDLTQSEPNPAIKSTIDKQNGKAKNAAPTKIVKTESELPASVGDEGLLSNDGGGIIAVYHDGTVYFVEDALIESAKNEGMSIENFTATLWMHEQGVHNGLRGMLGGDPLLLNMLLDGVHRSLGDTKINAGLSEEYHGMPKRVRTEEYIANLGEKIAKGGELTPDQRTVWQKVVDSVRRLLRKVFPKLKHTDREVEMIARKAIEWTLNGEAKVNQRKQGGDTRFALAGHTPKTEAMLNAYRKAAYGKEVRNDTIDLAAQQMGKKLKEDLPVTKDKFVHDSMRQVIGEGVDIARRQGAEKVTAAVNKVAGKIMKDEVRIPTAAPKAVRDVRDFSEKKGADRQKAKDVGELKKSYKTQVKAEPPEDAQTISQIAKSLGDEMKKEGKQAGSVQSMNDATDELLRRIERNSKGKEGATKHERALADLGNHVDSMRQAMNGKTEQEQAGIARDGLRALFGEGAYKAARRADNASVLVTMNRFEAAIKREKARVYGGLVGKLLTQINPQKLFNITGDEQLNLREQYEALMAEQEGRVKRLDAVHTASKELRQAQGYLKKLRKDAATPEAIEAQKHYVEKLADDVDRLAKQIDPNEAESLYRKLSQILAESNHQQTLLREMSAERLESASELILKEIEGNKDVIPESEEGNPESRGLVKLFLSDLKSSAEHIALSLFGSDKSVGYKFFYGKDVAKQNEADRFNMDARKKIEARVKELGITEKQMDLMIGEVKVRKLANGKTARLTDSQIMSLYAYTQDMGANMKVLMNGFKPSQFRGTKDNSTIIGRDVPQTQAIIDGLIAELTPQQKALVDTMIEGLQEIVPAANKATMSIMGYEKFGGEKHWTLNVDRVDNTRLTFSDLDKMPSLGPDSLTQVGLMKDRVPHTNPIVLMDAFTSYNEQARTMADVAGFSRHMLDRLTVLKNAEVKNAIVKRFGKAKYRYMVDKLMSTAHLKHHSDNWGTLTRTVASATRRVSTSILGFRVSSALANRVGAINLGNDIGQTNRAAQTKMMQKLLSQRSLGIFMKEDRAVLDKLMDDPFFYNRWVIDIARTYANIPTDSRAEKNPRELAKRRRTSKAMQGMARMEQANAIEAYKALREVGYGHEESIKLVEMATRRTQNPSTPLEETMLYTKIKEVGVLDPIFTFFGQPSVAAGILHRDAQLLAYAIKTKDKAATEKYAKNLVGSVTSAVATTAAVTAIRRSIALVSAGAMYGMMSDDDKEKQVLYTATGFAQEMADTAMPGAGRILQSILLPIGKVALKQQSLGAAVNSAVFSAPQQAGENIILSTWANAAVGPLRVVQGFKDEDYGQMVDGALRFVDGIGAIIGEPTGGITQGIRIAAGAAGVPTKKAEKQKSSGRITPRKIVSSRQPNR